MNFEEFDIIDSDWDNFEVMSILFFILLDFNMKFFYGCIVLILKEDGVVFVFWVLVYIFDDLNINVLVRVFDFLLLFVLEEEFLDEFFKFFESLFDLVVFLDFLFLLFCNGRFVDDLFCLGLVGYF